MKIIDALIIGAGPAGTSCALALAKHGWNVVIIDRSTFPRNKTCGGFIGPENEGFLSELGIWSRLLKEGACVVEESILTASKGASTVMPIDGTALGVSRQLLDKLMLERVKAAGVQVYEGAQVRNLYNNSRGFDVLIDHYGKDIQLNLRTKNVIDASGHRSPSNDLKDVQFGIAALYENMPQTARRVMLHCCKGGHVGINPFEDNQINICYVVDSKHFEDKGKDPEQVINDWRKENHHLEIVMQDSKRVSAWKAVYIPRRKIITLLEKGVWRAGDAAAFIDTIVGGGISVALLSGQLLASSLTEHTTEEERFKTYSNKYAKHFFAQRHLAGLLGSLIHEPWLAQSIVSFLGMSCKFRRKAMNYSRPGIIRNEINIREERGALREI